MKPFQASLVTCATRMVALGVLLGVAACSSREDEKPQDRQETQEKTAAEKRVMDAVVKMSTKLWRPAANAEARRKREANYQFVSNLLHECGLEMEFVRMSDGTAAFFNVISGCDEPYPDVPCSLVIDDDHVHGGAIFPEVAGKNDTNVVAFVALANGIVKTGRFEYDADSGLVMYSNSMPTSAIRSKGKTAFGMVFGFPVMEIGLFAESYRAVLLGKMAPREALALVQAKLDKIECPEMDAAATNAVARSVARVRAYFADRGLPALPDRGTGETEYSATLHGCKDGGLKYDAYKAHVSVDEEWVRSRLSVTFPVAKRNARIRALAARFNANLKDNRFTLVYDDEAGEVACRAQIHVVDVEDDCDAAMAILLRDPLPLLDTFVAAIEKAGASDASGKKR